VIALPFTTFVPSHFGVGTRQDLIDWRAMMEDGRARARAALRKTEAFGLADDQLGTYFDEVYFAMRARYGTWHGFDEMAVLNIVRDVEGEALGH
jgi:hypothetical protein